MYYYMGTHRTPSNPRSTESSRPYKENGIKKSGNFGLARNAWVSKAGPVAVLLISAMV
jgi:hypothetical protein